MENRLRTPGSFATRMSLMPRSCVREIMKSAGNDVISFAGGLPDPELFPMEDLCDAVREVLLSANRDALQYTSTEGYTPLREWVLEQHIRPYCPEAVTENVVITSGSQQGLDLIGKIFIDPGTPVLVERPTYLAAIQAFGLYQAHFTTVDLHENGPDPRQFCDRLRSCPPCFFYAIPDYQNPTGICYEPADRKVLCREMRKTGTLLVEDRPYSDLYYTSRPPEPLFSRLPGQAVVLGTFSKVLAPGIRMGWVYAPAPISRQIVAAKEATDLCSSLLSQKLLYQYLVRRDLPQHVELLRNRYRQKRDNMVELLAKYLPAGCSFRIPRGGMFIWAEMPERVSATSLLRLTLQKGLAFAPGRGFYTDGHRDCTMRLCFTNSTDRQMIEGVRILATCVETLLA